MSNKFEFKMLDNWYKYFINVSDSIRKGILYTPTMGE